MVSIKVPSLTLPTSSCRPAQWTGLLVVPTRHSIWRARQPGDFHLLHTESLKWWNEYIFWNKSTIVCQKPKLTESNYEYYLFFSRLEYSTIWIIFGHQKCSEIESKEIFKYSFQHWVLHRRADWLGSLCLLIDSLDSFSGSLDAYISTPIPRQHLHFSK